MTDNEILQAMSEMLQTIRQDLKDIRQDITNINLHLENVTDRNISILAENHIDLINKLNQSIKVADKNTIYEVYVNVLNEKVNRLEKEIQDLKDRIA